MPERLVAGRADSGAARAVLAEHQQRRAGGRADRGQLAGQLGIGRVVDGEHRFAPTDRGVDQLKTGGQHVRPGRTAHRDASGHLGPGHRDPGAGLGGDPQAAAVPGHDAASPDGADGGRATGRHDQAGPGRGQIRLVGVQPGQPAGQGSLRRTGQQGERQLPGQPRPQAAERVGEVEQMVGLVPARGQVVHDLGGSGGEAGRRGPRADRRGPRQPGRRRDRQPGQAPPGHPGDQVEHGGDNDRELGEQEMHEDDDHHADSDNLVAAGKSPGDEVTGTPWHLLRLCHDLGRRLGSQRPRCNARLSRQARPPGGQM